MTPPVRLLLVRHGQTEWHRDNRYVSRTDIGLTDTGRKQARSLARRAEHTRRVPIEEAGREELG